MPRAPRGGDGDCAAAAAAAAVPRGHGLERRIVDGVSGRRRQRRRQRRGHAVDAAAPAGPQLALLGAVSLVVALVLDSGWACLGAAGGRGLGAGARAWMARGSAAALVGGAAWLAFGRRA